MDYLVMQHCLIVGKSSVERLWYLLALPYG